MYLIDYPLSGSRHSRLAAPGHESIGDNCVGLGQRAAKSGTRAHWDACQETDTCGLE
jgi:hypothetical protein